MSIDGRSDPPSRRVLDSRRWSAEVLASGLLAIWPLISAGRRRYSPGRDPALAAPWGSGVTSITAGQQPAASMDVPPFEGSWLTGVEELILGVRVFHSSSGVPRADLSFTFAGLPQLLNTSTPLS